MTCVVCRSEIVGRRADAKTCSSACRQQRARQAKCDINVLVFDGETGPKTGSTNGMTSELKCDRKGRYSGVQTVADAAAIWATMSSEAKWAWLYVKGMAEARGLPPIATDGVSKVFVA